MLDERLSKKLVNLGELAELINRTGVAPSIVCPRCGKRSHNLTDIKERYCGYCHEFHPAQNPAFNRLIIKRGVMHDGVQEMTLECGHVITSVVTLSKQTELFCLACEAACQDVLKCADYDPEEFEDEDYDEDEDDEEDQEDDEEEDFDACGRPWN